MSVEHGAEWLDRTALAHGSVAEAEEPSFRLVRAGELKATPPVWLVRDVLEADTLALIFGDPIAGKSFVAVDLLCEHCDRDRLSRTRVEQGPVIMINGEGQKRTRPTH
jgi:RecA-family ATPase